MIDRDRVAVLLVLGLLGRLQADPTGSARALLGGGRRGVGGGSETDLCVHVEGVLVGSVFVGRCVCVWVGVPRTDLRLVTVEDLP